MQPALLAGLPLQPRAKRVRVVPGLLWLLPLLLQAHHVRYPPHDWMHPLSQPPSHCLHPLEVGVAVAETPLEELCRGSSRTVGCKHDKSDA